MVSEVEGGVRRGVFTEHLSTLTTCAVSGAVMRFGQSIYPSTGEWVSCMSQCHSGDCMSQCHYQPNTGESGCLVCPSVIIQKSGWCSS